MSMQSRAPERLLAQEPRSFLPPERLQGQAATPSQVTPERFSAPLQQLQREQLQQQVKVPPPHTQPAQQPLLPARSGGSRPVWAAAATAKAHRDAQLNAQSLNVPHVGWHLAHGSGGLAEDMSELQLLRDLLHALQGVESSCFYYDKEDGFFHINPEFVLIRPAWSLTQRILELGNLHARISEATNRALWLEGGHGGGQSLVHQALCEALREQLQEYYRVLALLMAETKAGESPSVNEEEKQTPLTLRRLWGWLRVPLERLRWLASLCEACAPLRGGALSSMVYGFSQRGDGPAAREACSTILRRVAGPLMSMIRTWMTEGEIQDPYEEFFVCANSSVPLESLWTDMYSLDIEMVPCFIPLDLARKILLTGKSVNFIRLCCLGQEWSPSEGHSGGQLGIAQPDDPQAAEDVPLERFSFQGGGGPLADLTAKVQNAALRTNKHLVALMMRQYALMEHGGALRRFLLLGQGDFVESLMDIAEEELCKDANKVYKHQLLGMVDMAVRQSSVSQVCSADTVARLGVKLLEPSAGDKGWDVFLLDYAIDSPLHVVFTPAVMLQYDRAFAFLWKLRRVSHGLAACWRQHMALHRHLMSSSRQASEQSSKVGFELRQTLHKCTCLRNELHHFVQNIHSYVMCEVLETSWVRLQLGWQNCTDLDEVIREHERYLACIEEGALLGPKTETIRSSVLALLALALEFTDLHNYVCMTSFEAVEDLRDGDAGDGRTPFARSFVECCCQLDQINAAFSQRLQALLKALETEPLLKQLSTDLRFLQSRLDFNSFYAKASAT